MPIRDNGRVVEWIGTANDVEDVCQAADDQRDLRARLLALTDGADALLATRTLEVTYAAAIELAREVLPGDGYGIWVSHPAAREWRMVCGHGVSEQFATARVERRSDHALLSRSVSSTSMRRRWLRPAAPPTQTEGVRSLLTIPLPDRRRAAGGAGRLSPHAHT